MTLSRLDECQSRESAPSGDPSSHFVDRVPAVSVTGEAVGEHLPAHTAESASDAALDGAPSVVILRACDGG